MQPDLSRLKPLSFDWDQGNKYKNWEKHKIWFKECEEIFFNHPLQILFDIKHSQKEKRFYALGKTNKNKPLLICFTLRKNKIRIISARIQSKKERLLKIKQQNAQKT